MSAASENLKRHQSQLDMDGCSVGVSRQAVDETLEQYDAMLAALKEATLQLEYLADKFGETGTGAAVLSRINAVISKAEGRIP